MATEEYSTADYRMININDLIIERSEENFVNKYLLEAWGKDGNSLKKVKKNGEYFNSRRHY